MEIFPVLIILILKPKLSICDKKALESYIVGGTYTTIRMYPHSAFLDIKCNGHWICGSAILNQKILLTAAHCLADCDFSLSSDVIYAMAGHEDLPRVTIKRRISHFVIHEDYDCVSILNDIGLTILEKPLPLTPVTKRIIIPKHFPTVKRAFVAGWGTIDEETGETSLSLKSVAQVLETADVCDLVNATRPGVFCAGSINESENYPSGGDSGSALVTKDGEEIGLVSYRMANIPTILAYTNTTFFYNWIEYNARTLFCNSKHSHS